MLDFDILVYFKPFPQDDHDDNSHVLTDFFLEELLRTNDTGSNMFHLPDSFEVPKYHFNKVRISHIESL